MEMMIRTPPMVGVPAFAVRLRPFFADILPDLELAQPLISQGPRATQRNSAVRLAKAVRKVV